MTGGSKRAWQAETMWENRRMLTLVGPAITFQQARAVEERYVREAARNDDPDRYMRRVGEAVAQCAARLVASAPPLTPEHHAPHATGPRADVVAFVGGGDNGGDALYACAFLAQQGMVATAFLLRASPHPRALAAARDAGARIVDLADRPLRAIEETDEWSLIREADVWIDGIVGIGAKGPLRGEIARSVTALNDLSAARPRHVLAIDVPSGLTDDEGCVKGAVMRATHTMAVGEFKRAQILPPAAKYCGVQGLIEMEWTGLGGFDATEGEGTSTEGPVYFYERPGVERLTHIPSFDDDKYARGVVGLVVGSDTYPGAGLLATRGALASGIGMVRLNSTRRVQDLVLAAEPGVVTVGGRIQSALIGPGLDEARREDVLELAQFCGQSGTPLVIDAWALDLLPEVKDIIMPEATVLTPHHGEAARLLTRLGTPTTRADIASDPLRYASILHEATGCHIVLKGPVTIVRSFEYADKLLDRALLASFLDPEAGTPAPDDAQATVTRCDSTVVTPTTTSWAGVAGSGDVLAGLIAGLLARPVRDGDTPPGPDGKPQAVTPERIATAVWLHGRAARLAADKHGGRAPIQARDIADAIPAALATPAS